MDHCKERTPVKIVTVQRPVLERQLLMYELVMGGPRPDKTVGLEGVPDVQGGARKSAPLRLDWWARAFF